MFKQNWSETWGNQLDNVFSPHDSVLLSAGTCPTQPFVFAGNFSSNADRVVAFNAFYRDKDKREAEKAILFLNSQLNKTSLSEIKLALVELLQVEIKKLTLVEAKELYVFDYIDPSVVMEEKESPNRIMIVFLGAIIGAFIGILFVLIRQINLKNTELETL